MKFQATKLTDVFEIEIEPHNDERGFFARTWCAEEFCRNRIAPALSQCSISFNTRKGTLRGMHYQAEPFEEAKLVRCTRGAIFDVALDLRPGSPTFHQWTASTLTADNRRALYIPKGCAHGFITLEDNTEILYQISDPYREGAGRGVRWNDPAFGIAWPAEVSVISERDRTYPDFQAIA